MKDDRGSATVETMFAIVVFVLVLMLVVGAGRVVVATAAVEAAARAAAREASIARTAGEATSVATSSAAATLQNRGLACSSLDVRVDTSGFARAVGLPATVSATVACTVSLSDVSFPGLPGSVVRQASFTSPLDTLRGRR